MPLTMIRIVGSATAVGLVAYWLLSLAPPAWFKWFLLVLGIVLVVGVVLDNRRYLTDLRKRNWLQLFERTEQRDTSALPAEPRGVSAETDERVTALGAGSPKDQIKRMNGPSGVLPHREGIPP